MRKLVEPSTKPRRKPVTSARGEREGRGEGVSAGAEADSCRAVASVAASVAAVGVGGAGMGGARVEVVGAGGDEEKVGEFVVEKDAVFAVVAVSG